MRHQSARTASRHKGVTKCSRRSGQCFETNRERKDFIDSGAYRAEPKASNADQRSKYQPKSNLV